MPKGFARTQSQPSIHSLSRGKGGRGIGIINQKFISKTDFFSKLNLYISVCRKTNIFLKWGLGRSPKRGEGGSPTLSPFPRGRGLGIGIENLLYFYKYRLFLQSVYISIITENLTQFNPFVYIAQITILKVGNNSLSFSDKKLSNHLIMREKFCIIEK